MPRWGKCFSVFLVRPQNTCFGVFLDQPVFFSAAGAGRPAAVRRPTPAGCRRSVGAKLMCLWLHYKTNSRIISRIIRLELVVGSSNYRAGSSNYRADSSNYQLSVGPGRLVFQLSAWYFQVICLLYTSPSPRDLSTSRMPSSA